jgi:hypothetical protein
MKQEFGLLDSFGSNLEVQKFIKIKEPICYNWLQCFSSLEDRWCLVLNVNSIQKQWEDLVMMLAGSQEA